MNQTMKKLFSKSGWLVMAAALLTGMASCSSDEDMVQSSETKSGSSIDVCVKAGFDNDATRSTVVQTTTGGVMTRDLQFTNNDKLYVYCLAAVDYGYPNNINTTTNYYLIGFLDLSDITSATSATFAGKLNVYQSTSTKVGDRYEQSPLTPSTYDFSGIADLLAGTGGMTTTATLVHAAAKKNVDYTIDENTKIIKISFMQMAHDVNTLMTKSLWIRGNYTSSSSGFSLDIVDYQPIFECTITGAPAEELELTASYLSSPEHDGVEFGKRTTDFTFTKPAGATSFDLAFVGIPHTGEYHRIQVASEKYGTMVINLGQTDNGEGAKPLPNTVIRVGNLPWLPNVINNTTGETISPDGDTYNFSSDCNITVSGSSIGYRYVFNGTNNTINLNGLVATNNSWGANCFDIIKESPTPNTTINVTGTNNHITCTNTEYTKAIDAQGNVLLKGEGALTITTKNSSFCGIAATNYTSENNSYSTTTELDVTDLLAAPGYNVVRSKRTDNPDGTYTWTYTVFPFIAPATGHTVIPTPNSGITYVFSDNSEIALTGHTEKTKIELHGSYNIIEMTDFRAEITSEPAWGNFIDLSEQSNINNLQIKVMGNNSITCTRDDYAKPISANEVSDVRFIGNGTLTLTTKYKETCGIFSGNNKPSNNNWETTDVSVDMTDMLGGIDSNSQRYTVVRSPRTDNGDGTYTWTYTVAPKNN